MHVKSAHLENYGRGSYVGGGIGVFGPEWDIESALDEEGVVLAELPDQNDARLASSNKADEGGQAANLIHVDIEGLRNNPGRSIAKYFSRPETSPRTATATCRPQRQRLAIDAPHVTSRMWNQAHTRSWSFTTRTAPTCSS